MIEPVALVGRWTLARLSAEPGVAAAFGTRVVPWADVSAGELPFLVHNNAGTEEYGASIGTPASSWRVLVDVVAWRPGLSRQGLEAGLLAAKRALLGPDGAGLGGDAEGAWVESESAGPLDLPPVIEEDSPPWSRLGHRIAVAVYAP